MNKLPSLESDRLILRPFVAGDAADVQHLASEREIASTTLLVPHPYEDGLAERWIATHEDAFSTRKTLDLAITLKQNGQLVGAIGLKLRLSDQCAELGYWIGRPFWSQGYCTEAGAALIEYGFDQLDLNRVFAKHMTRNPASGRVLRKLGMVREGCLRQHVKKWGEFEDLDIYGILKSPESAQPS